MPLPFPDLAPPDLVAAMADLYSDLHLPLLEAERVDRAVLVRVVADVTGRSIDESRAIVQGLLGLGFIAAIDGRFAPAGRN